MAPFASSANVASEELERLLREDFRSNSNLNRLTPARKSLSEITSGASEMALGDSNRRHTSSSSSTSSSSTNNSISISIHDEEQEVGRDDDKQPLLPIMYTSTTMSYPPPPLPPPDVLRQGQGQSHIQLNLGQPKNQHRQQTHGNGSNTISANATTTGNSSANVVPSTFIRERDFDLDERRCRICLESEEDDEDIDDDTSENPESRKLISPCLCKGSSRYIHLGCLEQWRIMSPKRTSTFSCDTCHYQYSFTRPWIAKVLGHRWFLHSVTLLMFLTICYGCSRLGHEMDDIGLWHWKKWIWSPADREGDDKLPTPQLPTFIGLDFMDILWGFVMMAAIGLVFLSVFGCNALCSECTGQDTGDDDDWYDCRSNSCTSCGFGALDGSSGGGEGVVLMIAIILFVTGIFGAIAGIYKVIATYNRRVLANMKETILEVK